MEDNEKKRTTVLLEEEAYTLILESQMKMFNETKKRIPIQKLVSDSIKKGLRIDEFVENELENLIYKDVMQIIEPLQHNGIYKGSSHYLTQEIAKKLSSNIMTQLKKHPK